MFLLIDNYDSFTYNVVHLLGASGVRDNLTVRRNDELSVAEAMAIGDEGIIISPGPCTPREAGITLALIKQCVSEKRPVLGICLGLQAMVEALGGRVETYQPPRHGKVSAIVCDNNAWLFKNMPHEFHATRYHSLAVTNMPADLQTIATSRDDNQVMAVQHKTLPMAAVQFHPESYYSEHGAAIIKNFLTFVSRQSVATSGAMIGLDVLTASLNRGENLQLAEVRSAFTAMMAGTEDVTAMVNFLRALSAKGETADEITAAAGVMRDHAAKITAPDNAIDIVGTGGDLKGTLNISTASSFVVAGLGFPVAKHGNRAITSQAGTADVQSQLGINIDYPLPRVQEAMDKLGFAFLFAPKHHAATRHVMPARKMLAEQKIKTIFNILGPLTNPASAKFYLLGVYDKKWLQPMAMALKNLGAIGAWVTCGNDGLDELSISGPSSVVKLQDGKLTMESVTPAMAGLPTHPLESIKGGTPDYNARAIMDLFQNNIGGDGKSDAAKKLAGFRDAVLYNAAAALVVLGAAQNLKDGVAMAKHSIDSGAALKKLKDFAALTKSA
ncbi:MAG: anthranilate phosphoribosyltransferase [Hydrotalea sp.]|nr:anthranilate phosphoribosyltransferase [Hydrotalea sp.]